MTNPKNATCAHDWTYLVDVETRRIGMRRCERCGMKVVIGQPLPVEPAVAPAGAKRPA